MKKKPIRIGDQEFLIAELNTAQVEDLVGAQKNGNGQVDIRRLAWRTVLLSMNNAEQPPTRMNPLGTDQAPHSYDSLSPVLGHASFWQLYAEVMALSFGKQPGETRPEAETGRSISSISEAA